jgi:2-oxoglutarate dehydrogenase E1 component
MKLPPSLLRSLRPSLNSNNKLFFTSSASGNDTFITGTSGNYVEEMHEAWLNDPSSVHVSWQAYFKSLASGRSSQESFSTPTSNNSTLTLTANTANRPSASLASIQDHLKVQLLVRAYQVRGHLRASIDPLGIMQPDRDFCPAPELEPSFYGFSPADLSNLRFHLGTGLLPEFQAAQPVMTLGEIVEQLQRTYSNTIGYEYSHIPDRQQCNWLRARIEVPQQYAFSKEEKLVILDRLLWSVLFEKFVALKYPSEKRFGLEGCESLIPGLKQIIDQSVEQGVERIVLGMPHRGRLNVLSNVVRKPNESIFSEFASGVGSNTETLNYSGDVKYHLGMSYTRPTPSGKHVELSLVANPSHLEAVDPVVEGKVRALQHFTNDTKEHAKSMALLMHGDAAFAGQGVVYETLGMSSLPNYRTGGTVHVIVNNQVGFTTDPRFARSSPYCSDLAKSISAPIFHVNADDVEAVVHVSKLAADWRREFKTDVVIDLVGYRRYGHNEIDQPAFTQPRMYSKIATKQNVLDVYAQKLLSENSITQEELEKMQERVWNLLETSYAASKSYNPEPFEWQTTKWPGMRGPKEVVAALLPPRPTGVTREQLNEIAQVFTAWPSKDFQPHPGVQRIMEARQRAILQDKDGIDMSTAEALAFGTLLQQGVHVRFGGQDVERGTFSQRHAVIHNQHPEMETTFLPLARFGDITVCNSHLSEFGALGFELGYSLVSPAALVLWEAQFGDFANNAQCIIDQFIASGERKWLQRSGLTLLLPHGYDGAGPEHSNARMERFLTLCDDDPLVLPSPLGRQIQDCNIQVAYPTTPANYFHLLRRQIEREFRKPLVIFESKSLMRHPLAKSHVNEFLSGTAFQPFIPAVVKDESEIDTLILCSGQVYYTLERTRQANNLHNIAIARVEQLSPFPYAQFLQEHARFSKTLKRLVWVQEEPLNLGAWAYVQPRIYTALGTNSKLNCEFVGRKPTAAVATGSKKQHTKEELEIISKALLGLHKDPKKIEIGVPIF